MYLQNKYTYWYYNIIQHAQTRLLSEDVYIEKHHIVPRSLGGNNAKSNIVNLTAREHFICHLLLTKMTIGNAMYKMIHALNMITNVKNIGKGRYIPSSRIYEYVRKCHNLAIKNSWTDEKRKHHSEKLIAYNVNVDKTSNTYLSRIKKIKKYQTTKKVWTELAIQNRLKNCLANAAKRKGKSNPAHSERMFKNYVSKNKDLFNQIWSLHDVGHNRRQISMQLEISWDRVNLAINRKQDIQMTLEKQNY
jgi:hypothetical protein